MLPRNGEGERERSRYYIQGRCHWPHNYNLKCNAPTARRPSFPPQRATPPEFNNMYLSTCTQDTLAQIHGGRYSVGLMYQNCNVKAALRGGVRRSSANPRPVSIGFLGGCYLVVAISVECALPFWRLRFRFFFYFFCRRFSSVTQSHTVFLRRLLCVTLGVVLFGLRSTNIRKAHVTPRSPPAAHVKNPGTPTAAAAAVLNVHWRNARRTALGLALRANRRSAALLAVPFETPPTAEPEQQQQPKRICDNNKCQSNNHHLSPRWSRRFRFRVGFVSCRSFCA